MNIAYTGTLAELPPKQRAKLETKLQKCMKRLERRGEKDVHVILSRQRHLHKVEITAHAYDRALAGAGSDADLAIAISDAIDKLEKQVIRMQEKFHDGHRMKDKQVTSASLDAAPGKSAEKPVKAGKAPAQRKTPQVFPVNSLDGHKPMTLEEAMLEIGPTATYLMFREARTNKQNVLMRRADGHFDLIET